jgi:hypothetical protein
MSYDYTGGCLCERVRYAGARCPSDLTSRCSQCGGRPSEPHSALLRRWRACGL